jgi:hypothetical protein
MSPEVEGEIWKSEQQGKKEWTVAHRAKPCLFDNTPRRLLIQRRGKAKC